jgi:hypothetical protein
VRTTDVASNNPKSITTLRAEQKSAASGASVPAYLRFAVPGNGDKSKKKRLVATTSPEIHKAPYRYERNLYCEFIKS